MSHLPHYLVCLEVGGGGESFHFFFKFIYLKGKTLEKEGVIGRGRSRGRGRSQEKEKGNKVQEWEMEWGRQRAREIVHTLLPSSGPCQSQKPETTAWSPVWAQ